MLKTYQRHHEEGKSFLVSRLSKIHLNPAEAFVLKAENLLGIIF